MNWGIYNPKQQPSNNRVLPVLKPSSIHEEVENLLVDLPRGHAQARRTVISETFGTSPGHLRQTFLEVMPFLMLGPHNASQIAIPWAFPGQFQGGIPRIPPNV